MLNDNDPDCAYPRGTEDKLSYRDRAVKNRRLVGMPEGEIGSIVDGLVDRMTRLVGDGFYRPVVTPAGIAAYAPTQELRDHLDAGWPHPLD